MTFVYFLSMNPDYLLDITPESEIFSRINTLKRYMEAADITAILLTHTPDIYYFSGTAQDCYLYVCLDQDPLLFVKRYLPRAELETPIKKILPVLSATQIPRKILDAHQRLPSIMGLAFDVVPARGYHMDESKMFVMEKIPSDAMAASLASLEILYLLKETMTSGAVMRDIFDLAVKTAEKMGYSREYLGLPQLKSRFVGHGIGLELVEAPVLAKDRSTQICPGMVFAVEPKFIFKDRFAAGIESVVLITDRGSRFLSQTENRGFSC